MKYFLLFFFSLSVFAIEQDHQCYPVTTGAYNAGMCATGTACVTAPLASSVTLTNGSLSKWGGISIRTMMYNLLRCEDAKVFPSVEDFTQSYTENKSVSKVYSATSTATSTVYEKYEPATDYTLAKWTVVTTAPTSGTYRKTIQRDQIQFVKTYAPASGYTKVIDACAIFAYYYNTGTYYQSLSTAWNAGKSCLNDEADATCQAAIATMDEITGTLDDFRQYNSETSGVIKLKETGASCLGNEECYSFICNASSVCEAPLSWCSCANNGEKVQTVAGKTQACCQNGELPYLIEPSTNKCSATYIPQDPLDADDYRISLIAGSNFSHISNPASCALRMTVVNADNALTQAGLEANLDNLKYYINNGYLILMALEWLFINPERNDCLTLKDDDDRALSTVMKEDIAQPIYDTLVNASKVYESLTQELQTKIQTSTEVYDQFADGIDTIRDNERLVRTFEEALLSGATVNFAANDDRTSTGLAPLLDAKRDDNEGKTRIEEILAVDYYNIKFSWSWAKNTLGYGPGKRWADRWSCRSLHRRGKNAFRVSYNIPYAYREDKTDGKYYIDPPIYNYTDGDDELGDSVFLAPNQRKIPSAEKNFLVTKFRERMLPYFGIDANTTGSLRGFLKYANSTQLADLLSEYAYQLFVNYSRAPKRDHPVETRYTTFTSQVSAVLNEITYYLQQLIAAREQRDQCLEAYKNYHPELAGSAGPGATGSFQEAQDKTRTAAKVDTPDIIAGKGAASGGVGNLELPNTQFSGSNIDQGGPLGSAVNINTSGTTSGSDVNGGKYSSYNAASAKRKETREKTYEKWSKKNDLTPLKSGNSTYFNKQTVAKLNSALLGTSSGSKTAVATVASISGSTDTSAAANKTRTSRRSQGNAGQSASTSSTKKATNAGGIGEFPGFGQDEFASTSAGLEEREESKNKKASELAQAVNLDDIEKNKAKYDSNEDDNLFKKITKAYFRAGYPRLLRKKEN